MVQSVPGVGGVNVLADKAVYQIYSTYTHMQTHTAMGVGAVCLRRYAAKALRSTETWHRAGRQKHNKIENKYNMPTVPLKLPGSRQQVPSYGRVLSGCG